MVAPEAPPVVAGVGAVVAAGALLGLVAGAFYLRARGKATGFGFSTFQVGLGWGWGWGCWVHRSCSRPLTSHLSSQAEGDAEEDFSPWQEGTSPTLVSVPNPVFGSHDAFCEPFDVSGGGGGQ